MGGQHAANGLLITEDGYFITNRHCIPNLDGMQIKLHNKKCYSIEKVCFQSRCKIDKKFTLTEKTSDLALVKAKIRNKSVSKKYSFCEISKIKTLEPIVLLTRMGEEINLKGGITSSIQDYKNISYSNLNTKKGDSGGIIANTNGQIIGIHFCGTSNDSYYSYSVSSSKMLDLIKFAKRNLEQKL